VSTQHRDSHSLPSQLLEENGKGRLPSHAFARTWLKKSLEPWNSALRKSSPAAQPCDNAIPEQIVFAQDISDRQKHLCFAFPIYPGLHSKTVSCTAAFNVRESG